MSNYTNVWESMGKPCSCMQFIKSRIFFNTSHTRIRISTASHARIRIRYCKSRENPYQVLPVLCTASERAMKSKVKIIIAIVPSYTGKISLICCRWHCYSCYTLITIQMATNSCSFVLWWCLYSTTPTRKIMETPELGTPHYNGQNCWIPMCLVPLCCYIDLVITGKKN